MAAFNFRLENILQIKMKIEEQEKVNFGNVSARLFEAREKLEKLCERKLDCEQKLRTYLNNGSTVIDIKQAEDAVEIVKMYMRIQQLETKKIETELDEARKKLEFAIQERKIYEKLKEKDFEEFKHELNKKEGIEIDELVSYRYSPNVVSDEVS